MPILLAACNNDLGREAVELLDHHGVAFTYVEVNGFMEPRLQVGDDELTGLDEIRAHIDEIVQLSMA